MRAIPFTGCIDLKRDLMDNSPSLSGNGIGFTPQFFTGSGPGFYRCT